MATINGTAGNDVISGSAADDTLRGLGGDDAIDGGGGNDFIDGGAGDDTMSGGAGNDTYVVDSPGDVIVELGNEGSDSVTSFITHTLESNVEILRLIGTTSSWGIGNGLGNAIRGNDSSNSLFGLGGDDSLAGVVGDDVLNGGTGNDTLEGGLGADTFYFELDDIAAANSTDTIRDLNFQQGDTVLLAGYGPGGSDIPLDSYAAVEAFVYNHPEVAAATLSNGTLRLTIPRGGFTEVINITGGAAGYKDAFDNANPLPQADSGSTSENTPIVVDVLANDTNATGPLTITSASAPAGQGSVTVQAGKLSFDPIGDFDYLAAGESAEVIIEYQVENAGGRTATSTLTLTIQGINDAALIGGTATGSVTENAVNNLATGQLTVSDADHDQNSFTAQSSVSGTYGTFSINAAGAWTYALDNSRLATDLLSTGQTVLDSFTVTSIDGTQKQVSVTVNGFTDPITLPGPCTQENDPNNRDGHSAGTVTFGSLSSSQLSQANSIRGTTGNDMIDSKARDDVVYSWGGNDTVDGGEGNDIIYAGSGNDRVSGGQGVDTLYGGSGSDTIAGGQGNDIIIGGFGADTLTGDQGDDIFRFLETCDTNDTITDFNHGRDKIDLSQFKVNGADFDFNPATQAQAFSAGHNLIYYTSGGKTIILGNTDGNTNTAELMIVLTGTTDLTPSDFLL